MFLLNLRSRHLLLQAVSFLFQFLKVNLTREGDQLHHGNQKVEDCTLQSCWNECLAKSNYEEKLSGIREFNAKSKRLKRGLAITPIKFAPSFFTGHFYQVNVFKYSLRLFDTDLANARWIFQHPYSNTTDSYYTEICNKSTFLKENLANLNFFVNFNWS